MKENKAIVQEIWNTSILYPQTSKEFYHYIKFQKNIMNRKCSSRKLFSKILQYSQENTCRNLCFNKNAGLKACSFIKKRLTHSRFFFEYWEVFKATIFKNICERLLLRVSLELFSTLTNNIGSEEDVFSQNKNHSKTQLHKKKKKLSFHDALYHFFLLYFSTSCQAAFALHNKRWY